MLARLGNVLYWAGCVLTGLVLVGGLLMFGGLENADVAFYALLTVVAAVLVWLIGRGAKYVLAGK